MKNYMPFGEFVRRLQENDEVNEISKLKLRRYVDDAAGDLRDKSVKAGKNSSDVETWLKSSKRLRGIRKAAEKLAGSHAARVPASEETVNEISDGAMDRYSAKASRELDGGKRNKRLSGISLVQAKKHRKYGGASGEGAAMDTADYTRKVRNRGARMAEEAVNEISRELAAKYAQRATMWKYDKQEVLNEPGREGVKKNILSKWKKRNVGIDRAEKRVAKGMSEETVNELSTEKLKRYVAKVKDEGEDKGLYTDDEKTYEKRRVGLAKARKRGVSEGRIDEISHRTAWNYIHKADDQLKSLSNKSVYGDASKDDYKTIVKRAKGLSMAKDAARRGDAADSKRRRDAAIEKHGTEHGVHQSKNYIMRHYPGKTDDELAKVKADLKTKGQRTRLMGRLGKDNPNAEIYKKKRDYQNIRKAHAAHFDVYARAKNEEVEVDEAHGMSAKFTKALSKPFAYTKFLKSVAAKDKYDRDSGAKYFAYAKGARKALGPKRPVSESERIDEISNRKAGEYYINAQNWKSDLSDKLGDESHPKVRMGYEVSKKEHRGLENRSKGIERAKKRILRSPGNRVWLDRVNHRLGVDESEEVNEVSRDLLKSYYRKAGDKIRANHWKAEGGIPLSPRDEKNDAKRSKGIRMADSKLGGYAKVIAKEETEVNEISTEKLKAYKDAAKKQGAFGYGYTPKDDADAKRSFKRSTGITKASERIRDRENPVNPKVHDLSHMHHDGDVYDHTQTSDVKDGDVMKLHGGRTAVMYKAWPTMVHGKSEHLHTLKAGRSWDNVSQGRYKASAALAAKHATVKEETEEVNEISDRLARRYLYRAERRKTKDDAEDDRRSRGIAMVKSKMFPKKIDGSPTDAKVQTRKKYSPTSRYYIGDQRAWLEKKDEKK